SAPWNDNLKASSLPMGDLGSGNEQGLTAHIVPMQDAIPGLLGRFCKPEQFAIFPIYDAFIDEKIQIDGTAPIALTDQHDRNRLDLACLHKRQHLEQLIQGAIPAGKGDQRFGSQKEVKLAHREVVKV